MNAKLMALMLLASAIAPLFPTVTQFVALPGVGNAMLGSSTAVLVANLTSSSQYDVQVVSLFYASGLYWMVIYNARAGVFYYTMSKTGLSWIPLQPLGVPSPPSYRFYYYYSPVFNTLYYVYAPGNLSIIIYRLKPTSDGVLAVAGSEVVDFPALGDYISRVGALTVDSQGYLWITAVYCDEWVDEEGYIVVSSMPILARGSLTNGSFGTVDAGFPVALAHLDLFSEFAYVTYLFPHLSLGVVLIYQNSQEYPEGFTATWWNASTPVVSKFYGFPDYLTMVSGAVMCRDRVVVTTVSYGLPNHIWNLDANGLALVNDSSYPGYAPVPVACDGSSGLVYMAYLSSGLVYYANYSVYSYVFGQGTAVASTGGTAYNPTAVLAGSNLLIAWHEYYSGYTLVKAVVVDTLTMATGIPVNLTLTAIVEPNDTIAPHLYVWYFDGVNDYVVIPLSVYGWSGITIQEWLYPFHPKVNPWYSKFSMIGDAWTDIPAVLWRTNNMYDYTGLSLYFATRKPDGTERPYGFSIYAYRNSWVNTAWRFSLSDRTLVGYINGGRIYSVAVPSTEYTVLEWNPDTATYPQRYKQFVLGANVLGAENMKMMQGNILIYSRALLDSEISNIYTSNIINASSLVVFLDPTFYNGTHYIDLSGRGNHGVGYNNVSRIPDTRQWLYLVKGRDSDGLVHFRFFPANTRVEIYNATSNSLVTSFIITGTPNVAGLVEDYAVSLPAGNYTVRVYTYLNKTVSQNHGSSRYTYIARYRLNDMVRLALSANALGSLRYQVYDQTTGTLVLDNTVPTSLNYIDIQLPVANSTWALQAYAGAPVLYWSNQVALRTDYLVLNALPSRNRADLSTGVSVNYTVRYSDGSTPPVLNVNVTAVLTQLGVYTPADAWWRVDVYSDATTSAEPPSSPYSYKGTVYPLSTHSFFVNSLYDVPSGYDSSYVYAGVPFSDAPYWAKAVGAPSTGFALVYQSLVYLPLSGSYTFELVSVKGARLYVNGTLVIDGWGSAGTRSATVFLTAGWYNIIIKYWQSTSTLRLLLGVTLPNGTAVKPLRPVYGIQMRPPDTSYSVSLPSTPLTLFANYTLGTATATTPSVGLGVPGQATITIQSYDAGSWLTSNATVVLTWDQVIVNSFTPSKPRFTVGDPPSFNIKAVYAFDNSSFYGSFTLNDTSTKTSVGAYGYSIIGVSDSLYGLARFSGNTTTTAVFDKLVLDSYVFMVNNTVVGNNTRIDYSSSLNITAVLKHAYDGLILNSTNAVKVQLAGVDASWNGSVWVATVQPPGAITAVGHSVVSYAESTLGVRFVDSIVFRVIYDSVNATYYTSDLVGNTVTLKLVYGYDGALVSSGSVCVNDSDTIVCGSISNGYATLGFNRFTNGTVSFVNATDGVFVFSNPVKPDKLAVKWASSDGKISLVGTVDVYYYNHTELPGYFRLACELRGNASILVNTSLPPVLVKVNGTPVGFSYVNGVVVFYNLSSTVEAYYSTLVSASTLPGAAPAGAVYEIGFADDSTLEQSVLRIGVLVNGSSVVPFVYYNGSVFYASGVSGLSYPLDVVVGWECSNGVAGVNAMVVYVLGKYTYYSTLRSVFRDVNVSSCPSKLYPYLYIPGDLAGVVDKYGGLSSEVLRFLASGALRINVVGPIPAGGLVKYVTLASPVRIVYSAGNVYTEPGSGSTLTLVGFRGFTLSYSVAGASVSNILIARDEYPLDFPRGISLLVIADPSSRTVSLVQVSPVSEPREYMPIPVPRITVPALPNPQPLVFPGSWDSPAFIVLYSAAVAVAIVATRITGSVPRGIMVAAMSFGLVLLGIGVFTRDFSAVSVALVALVTAVGVEVARRQAG